MCLSFQKYLAVGELGKATDTLDATGSVVLEKTFGNTANPGSVFSPHGGQGMMEHTKQRAACHGVFVMLVLFPTEHITGVEIEEKLKTFTGDIMQVPPL